MKTIMRTLVFTFILVFGSNLLSAQHKIGYIYSDSLLIEMPRYDTIKTLIAEKQAFHTAELKRQEQELQRMYDGFEKSKSDPSVTRAYLDLQQAELEESQRRIQRYQNYAQEDLTNYQTKLSKPLLDSLNKAVEEVAKEKKYDYIIDAGIGGYWYLSPTDDLMPAVRKKLGLK